MTRRFSTVLAVLLAGAVAAPALAGKVGFVDVEKALVATQEGTARLKELEEWSRPRRERIAELRRKAAEAKAALERSRSVASPDALERLEKEAVEAQRAVEDAVREFRRELDARQNEVLKRVAERMRAVIEDYARRNGYDAVLIFKPRTIIYLSDEADLTDTVVKLYNERFPLEKKKETGR